MADCEKDTILSYFKWFILMILLTAFQERTEQSFTVSTKTSTMFPGWISGLLE